MGSLATQLASFITSLVKVCEDERENRLRENTVGKFQVNMEKHSGAPKGGAAGLQPSQTPKN
jgi:hypothetical protein